VQNHATVPALATLVVAVTLIFAVPVDAATSPQRRRKQVAPKKAVPTWPSYEARRDDFLRRVRGANAAGQSAPDPLSQFLVSEIIVTGIYETENGNVVFLERAFESQSEREVSKRIEKAPERPAAAMSPQPPTR
jgi:hypothetical protein